MATIARYTEEILKGKDLSFEEAKGLLDTIFEGEVSEAEIAAFLTAMRGKEVCVNELAGLAKSLREHAVKVECGIETLVDTCGTGGAAVKTFNISTGAALVAAGAGIYVAKHGNRGITSACGSADVLSELGVKINAAPDIIGECIRGAHIGFMFAPMFHPAMKYVQPVRKSLGFRTVFNILGPLANPAGVKAQVIGVPEESLMWTVVKALEVLGSKHVIVVHSNGLDEISTFAVTKILELKNGRILEYELNAGDYGFEPAKADLLKANDAKASAEIIKDILTGKENGVRKDIVLLNAAAAIMVGDMAENFDDAINLANISVGSGKAFNCLEKLITISNS